MSKVFADTGNETPICPELYLQVEFQPRLIFLKVVFSNVDLWLQIDFQPLQV